MKTTTTFFLTTLFLLFSNTIFCNPITNAQVPKTGNASETAFADYRNFTVIDDFNDGVDMWWQPEFSGSTMGIIIEDDEGNPLTYRAHETGIVNPHTGSTGSMQLAFVWDDDIEWIEPAPNVTASHFIRVFFPTVYSMEPERRFEPGQALEVFIYGDGSGNRMRLMVRDGILQLEGSPWQIIDWTGWRRFTWDYNDVANVVGWVTGNGEMTEGEPFFFDSFQITRNESGTTTEGVLFLDDLRIVDPFTVTFYIIDADGTEVITINGAQYDAGLTDFGLFPGEHQFAVAKTGYQTYSGSFCVEDDDLIIEVVLTPSVDGQMPGDANCDGAVNVMDLINMANYFTGGAPDPFCFDNADVSGDGVINVIDFILTSEIFVGYDTGDGTVTDIDGNVYQTVIIGEQEWMAQNLRVSKYNNNEAILTGLSNLEWSGATTGAYAIYPHGNIPGLNSDEEVLEAYGKLYNWFAVADERGLCPEGWSVPSNDDWSQLVDYIVSHGFPNSNITNGSGNALKSCRQVDSPLGGDCDTSEHPRWGSHGTHHGFDEFGFSGLPGGIRVSNGGFYHNIGTYGYWWTSNEYYEIPTTAWRMLMSSIYGYIDLGVTSSKSTGLSVRCFRSVTEEPSLYNLHLEVHPENAGTVSGEGEYQEGSEVSINATANEGWAFVEWTGDIEVLGNPGSPEVSFAMPAQNISLTANFAAAGIDPENTEILLNKSGAAGLVPPVINNELSRGAAFDGRYVYVASRKDGNHIYYWDVENPGDDPGSLVLTETVSGGTWVISDVRSVDGHIYVSNMTHEEGQVFKIYRWDGVDDDDPQPVFEYQLPSAGIRLGDAISIIGNPPDNGYIFASNFAWPNNVSEFYVWNFNGGKSDPEVIPINPLESLRMGQYGRVNSIPDVDDLLLVTGAEMGIAVMDYSGNILAETAEPMVQNRSFDPRVWEYNGGRYLSFTVNREWEGQGAYFQVLDITDGNNLVEAIQNITAETIEGIKVYEHIFGAGPAIWVGATHGFGFGDNGKPRTMSFAMQNGFVVVEYSN